MTLVLLHTSEFRKAPIILLVFVAGYSNPQLRYLFQFHDICNYFHGPPVDSKLVTGIQKTLT
jgi:hypothetical protein